MKTELFNPSHIQSWIDEIPEYTEKKRKIKTLLNELEMLKGKLDIDSMNKKIENMNIITNLIVNCEPLIHHKGSFSQSECLLCGKIIEGVQRNFHQIPKICNNCEENAFFCLACGSNIPFDRKICNKCYHDKNIQTEIIQKMPLIVEGHKKQGQKILGANNPSKRMDVRKKISEGVTQSYIDNPELRLMKLLPAQREGEYRSGLERKVAAILVDNDIPFKYEGGRMLYKGKGRIVDFLIDDKIAIEVAGYIRSNHEREDIDNYLEKVEAFSENYPISIVITYPEYVNYFLPLTKKYKDLHIIQLPFSKHKVSLMLENITNIDYGHFLAFHEHKCKNLHCHTSWNVGVTITGYLETNEVMLIDFGDLKKIVKDVVDEFDHKLIVRDIYVKRLTRKGTEIEYTSSTHKYHQFILPNDEVMIMEKEPTIEKISEYIIEKILEKLPMNINSIILYLQEGVDNKIAIHTERDIYGWDKLVDIIKYHQEYSEIEIIK